MMNNKPYKIDYLKSAIIVSKKFLKAASVCDSKEYNDDNPPAPAVEQSASAALPMPC